MKNLKKLLCLLFAITLLSVNVLAKTFYTPSFTFIMRGITNPKEEKLVSFGDKIELVKKIKKNSYTARVNGSKKLYYTYLNWMQPYNNVDKYKSYIKNNNVLLKQKTDTTKITKIKTETMEKHINILNDFTKDFNPKGKTDSEKLLYILNYVNNKNIKYDNSEYVPEGYKYNEYQIVTLPAKKTKCSGTAMLLAYLFNKTNLEHRLVRSVRYNNATSTKKPGATHLYNEVKIDGVWYKIDGTAMLLDEKTGQKPYKKIDKSFYITYLGLEENVPYFNEPDDANYPNYLFQASKIFNPKENIEDNCEYQYIWSGLTTKQYLKK